MEQNMQWVALRIHMGVTIIQLSFPSGRFPGTEQGTLKTYDEFSTAWACRNLKPSTCHPACEEIQ